MPTREEIIARKTAMRDAGMQWANMNDSSWGPGQEALWKKHQMSTIKFTAPERPVQYGTVVALPGVGNLGQIAALASSALAIPQVREGIANGAQAAWDWVSDKAGKTANILRAGALATEAQLRGMFNNGNASGGNNNQGNNNQGNNSGNSQGNTTNTGNNTGTAQPAPNTGTAQPSQGGATGQAAGTSQPAQGSQSSGTAATGGSTPPKKGWQDRFGDKWDAAKAKRVTGYPLRHPFKTLGTIGATGYLLQKPIRRYVKPFIHNVNQDISADQPQYMPYGLQPAVPGDSLNNATNQNTQVAGDTISNTNTVNVNDSYEQWLRQQGPTN